MFQPFEMDDEQVKRQHQSPIKTRQNNYTDKFSKSITRNFMHNAPFKEEQYSQEPSQQPQKQTYETVREKRRHIRQNSKMLQPLSNPEKIEVQNLAQMKLSNAFNELIIEDQQIEEPPSPYKSKSASPQPLICRKKSEDHPIKIVNIDIPSRNQANILFYEQEDENIQQENIELEQSSSPKQQELPRYLQQIDMSSNLSAFEEVVVKNHTQYFHIHNKQKLTQEVLSNVKDLHTLKMMLFRDNSGFNTFWPEYFMKFPTDELPIICAKRKTARPISTYILSMSPTDFQQNSQNYLGKIKSNALGDILYVYGPGYSPSNAKDKKQKQRQMIATIRYQNNFLNTSKPREFEVFTIKEQYKYFDLKGVKMYGDEPGLDQLFNHEVNRDRMNIYTNKKPVWNELAGGFMLNFKGRVPCASIKNFILDDPFGHEAVIFGRKQKNEFVLEITDKISPMVAMAVALSAFDTRIMCE